jgi:hypothetical protein
MAKRKRPEKTNSEVNEERGEKPIPIWERHWFPAALFLLLSLVYFHEFVLSDKVVYGYDAGLDFHKGEGMSFLEKVETMAQPMWNPQMGGLPQSEEIRPQYFLTYPIYFFTSFHRYLGWRYILTMFCAGFGMFLFLKQMQIQRWVAIWGGVAYMSAPTLMAFTFAGQYAKMGVIALYPWMWYCLDRGLYSRRLVYFAGLAVTIAWGIYSPHPKMLYYALCGTGLYFFFRTYQWYQVERDAKQAASRVGLFVFAVVLGLGLGAEGTFPLYSYTGSESKRAAGAEGSGRTDEQQLAYAQSWSLHPEEVGSLIVPEFGGFRLPKEGSSTYWGRNPAKDNSEYFGVIVVLLALLVVPDLRRRPLVAFLCAVFVLALAYTLGGHTPVHWLAYYLLPGIKLFRSVGMAAYIFAFPACVLAALGLERLLAASEDGGDERALLQKRLWVGGGILSGIALLLAVAPETIVSLWNSLFYSDIPPHKQQILHAGIEWLAKGGLYVGLTVLGAVGVLFLRINRTISTGLMVVGLCLLTLCDTWRINQVFLKYENPNTHTDLRKENLRAKQLMQRDGDLFRMLPLPDHPILQQSGLGIDGIPSMTGFNNLTVGRYDRILREIEPVTNLLWSKYALGREIPYADADLLAAIHPLVNLLNGKYLVVPRGVALQPAEDLFPLVGELDNYRIYLNPQAMPWFYMVAHSEMMSDEEQIVEVLRSGQVDLKNIALVEEDLSLALTGEGDIARDQIDVLVHDPPAGLIRLQANSEGPRLLVVSENYQSNWSVVVDGQDAQMLRVNYIWKGVVLPAGEHVVEFRYYSHMLAWSRMATFSSIFLVLFICVGEFFRRRRVAQSE